MPEEFLEPLRRVLGWLLALRAGRGRIVCPDHRIEHTGKNAGVIVIACELARHDPAADRDGLLAVAVEQAELLVARLEREGESTCFTFRPGRHDPYNCSNNVIDGGACSDALAELVMTFGERLSADQRARYAHACVLHAQTYLRYAILDKGIPAQRAWAMTGTAGAFHLARHEVLELAVREGERILAQLQHRDGSFPYHPLDQGAGHPGASDVSAFYQSRVTGFTLFSLERIGADPTRPGSREPLLRGLDFLLALQAPDGTKCGQVEAKPWYWGAEYEVASHPFDVYALARGWHHFRSARHAEGALRAARAWFAHLAPDGRPTSHHPGPGRGRSYQCPVFWAGHASWMARALEDLGAIARSAGAPPASPGAGLELATTHFPDAALVRLEDSAVVAWVRGARPRPNVHHGSPLGSGLLRVWGKREGADLLGRTRAERLPVAEWCGRAGSWAWARGWRSGREELRFSLWLARNAWRGARYGEALGAPLGVFRRGVLAYASPLVSSAFELEPRLDPSGTGVTLEGRLAHRDGTVLPRSSFVRRFELTGDGLAVDEQRIADGAARALALRVPLRARDVVREGTRVRYHLG